MVGLGLVLMLLAVGERSAELPLQMLLVFGSAKLFGEIFERLHQPDIVGEILAGVLIGPSILGLVEPNELLVALAELGVMFLLFRVGLEVKPTEFMKVGPTATLVALLGVAVPFVAGWGLGIAWDITQIESIFLGAAMVATSVGITAQVLASKGLLQVRASKIILAAAVIDDVLGLIVLALASNIAEGQVNLIELGLTAGLAVGFTFIVARWGTHAVGKIVPRLNEKLSVAEGQFAISICLLFGLSLLAVYAGIAAIIGAFLAGMALSESSSHRVHDLTHGVAELLVPFFLVGIGLQFELSPFAEVSNLVFAMVVLVVAVASKLIGCGAGALTGLGKTDAFRVGVGMTPRGEVGMVVAQIGMAMQVVSTQVFGIVVFMSVMTTLIAPPLLKVAYRDLTSSPSKGGFLQSE